MADKTSASLCWIFLSVCFLVSVSEDVTTKPGKDVLLPCQAPSNTDISAVEWVRDSKTVCLNRKHKQEDLCEPEEQDPSFENRAQLSNSWQKNGNVSLILKNVTSSDGGRYECHVVQSGAKRMKRAVLETQPINTVSLNVVEPGHDVVEGNKNGNPGLTVGLPVVGALLLLGLVVGFVISRKRKGFTKQNYQQPPAAVAGENQQV